VNLTILEEAFEEHVKRKVSVVDFKIVVTVNIVYVAENGGDQTVEAMGTNGIRVCVVSISHKRVDSAIH